jgi:hypothetical protein
MLIRTVIGQMFHLCATLGRLTFWILFIIFAGIHLITNHSESWLIAFRTPKFSLASVVVMNNAFWKFHFFIDRNDVSLQ